MKLFAIYVGGEHPDAHIEVHDIRFVAAETIRGTHDALLKQWWGTPGTLHIDCWAEIDHVDGYDIELRLEPWKGAEKLFYVNLGGYDPADFAEQHKNVFVVAPNLTTAKNRALETIPHWKDAHRDDLYEAEQVFNLDEVLGGLHIHLVPSDRTQSEPRFTCKYTPLK